MHYSYKQLFIGMLLGGAVSISYADVVIVVAAKSPITALSQAQASQIFLGQLAEIPASGQVVPIDQKEGAHARNEFYEKVAGKGVAQIKAYWAKLTFAGYGQPPRAVSSNEEVKKLLLENSRRIGYIDKASVDESVRVVLAP